MTSLPPSGLTSLGLTPAELTPAELTPAELTPAGLSPAEAALVTEACNKSSVLWVRTVGSQRHHLAWHAWHDDAAYVVYGVGEQVLPMMSGQVEVVVPSKETGARLVRFMAQADILRARSAQWKAAAAVLSAARLNSTDPQRQDDRWASEALVTRLTPLWLAAAGAGDDSADSGAAPPAGSAASTVGEHQPWHLRGRDQARRVLRRSRHV